MSVGVRSEKQLPEGDGALVNCKPRIVSAEILVGTATNAGDLARRELLDGNDRPVPPMKSAVSDLI